MSNNRISLPTFTLACSSGTNYYFPIPEWASPDNEISKTVDLFDFWDNDIDTVDRGINTQTLKIGGTICICGVWEGVCLPFCPDSFCFSQAMTTFLDSFRQAMNNGEEFTINELGNCLNGVYVVRNFSFNTIKRTPSCFRWELDLERVSDV